MPSSHLILCHPLLLLPPVPPSIRVFSNESTLRTRWPKYWSFSFSIRPSNEHPGLISFRMDWLDLLAVQGTLKSLLQHHSSKASVLQCSAFFTVQLSHPHMTTGKTTALTRRTCVGKVIHSLLSQYLLSTYCVPQYFIHGVNVQACSCVNPASRAGVFQGFSLSFSKNRFFSLPGLRCSSLSVPLGGKEVFLPFFVFTSLDDTPSQAGHCRQDRFWSDGFL